MKTILPKVVDANEAIFKQLEKKNLLKRFFTAAGSIDLVERPYDVKNVYQTNEAFGGHKLICVNYNLSEPQLGYHKEKEDFILISDNPVQYKALYLLVCLDKEEDLANKICKEEISDDDFIIIRLKFNDPNLSFFTMNEGVLHCELVEKSEAKRHPYFYVTEPSNLDNIGVDLGDYVIEFAY